MKLSKIFRLTSPALGILLGISSAIAGYEYHVPFKGLQVGAPVSTPAPAPKTYAQLDASRKSGTGVISNYTISAGSVFYVQSNIAQSAFYYEGHVLSYYGAVGLGSPSLALLYDSGGSLYLNSTRLYLGSRAPLSTDVVGWTWDGTVATLYINNQKVYTTPPGTLPAGPLRALLYSNGGAADANFGASPFAYSPPENAPAGFFE